MKPHYLIQQISKILAVLYSIVFIVFFLTTGKFGSSLLEVIVLIVFAIFIIILNIAPFFMLTNAILKLPFLWNKIILLIVQIGLSLFTVYVYYDVFYVHLDAQGAIVLFFLPVLRSYPIVLIAIFAVKSLNYGINTYFSKK